jgi:hypothetical protein
MKMIVKNGNANKEIIGFPNSKFILTADVNLVKVKPKPISFWYFSIESFKK